MAKGIASSDTLDFQSLPDIFSLKSNDFNEDFIEDVKVAHYLHTEIEPMAEICRKIMLASCHTNEAALRELIVNQDSSKLALFRGFKRFMEEDLATNPLLRNFTRSSMKKHCGNIAYEMMKVSI